MKFPVRLCRTGNVLVYNYLTTFKATRTLDAIRITTLPTPLKNPTGGLQPILLVKAEILCRGYRFSSVFVCCSSSFSFAFSRNSRVCLQSFISIKNITAASASAIAGINPSHVPIGRTSAMQIAERIVNVICRYKIIKT